MNPKYRPAFILGMVFVLMAPYFGFVIYYSQRFPPNHWPSWFTNAILIWFIVNFVTLMLLMRLKVSVTLSLREIPMPLRTTRKSTRPRASDRSMVATIQPHGLMRFETDRRRRY